MSAQNRSPGKLTVARAKANHVHRKDQLTIGVRVIWTAKRSAGYKQPRSNQAVGQEHRLGRVG